MTSQEKINHPLHDNDASQFEITVIQVYRVMTQKKKVPLVGGGNKFSPGSEKLLDQLSAHNSIVPDCHPWRNDIYYSRQRLTTHQSTERVYGDLPSRGTAILSFHHASRLRRFPSASAIRQDPADVSTVCTLPAQDSRT